MRIILNKSVYTKHYTPLHLSDLSKEAKHRLKVIDWHFSHDRNISLTSRHFGHSRTSVTEWIKIYKPYNLMTLEYKSRKPKHTPRDKIDIAIKDKIIGLRKMYPEFGKHKIWLKINKEVSESTVGRYIEGMIGAPRRYAPGKKTKYRKKLRKPKDYKVKEEIPRPFLSDISPREIFENIIKSDPKIAKLLRKSTGQEDFNSLYEEAINNLKNNELENALQLFEKCIDKSILPEKDKRRKMINEKIIDICKKLAKIKYEEGGRSYKNKKYEEAINLWKNAKKYYKKAELSNKAEEIQKIIDKTIKKFNLKVDNEPEIILIDESK